MSDSIYTILGSTGNIGTALAKELKRYTTNIRLVSRNPQKINENDELVKANLLNADEVDKAVSGSTVVFLVAGITYNTKIWKEQWPIIMQNTINACKKHGTKLSFFDNMYCYDPAQVGNLTEDSPINPKSEKGKVRAKIAQMLMDEVQNGSLQAMICRAADFYGPNAKLSILNQSVIERMAAGKTAQWLYNADKKHSFTYIPDAAYATALLSQKPDAWSQVWHMPTISPFPTARDIVHILSEDLGTKPKISVLAPWAVNLLSVFMPVLKEVKEMSYQMDNDYCFDSSKILKSYNVRPTGLRKGLAACTEVVRKK